MPLDPGIHQFLTVLESLNLPALPDQTPQDARRGFEALVLRWRLPETIVPVASTDDQMIPGPAGDLPVRIYRPDKPGPAPTVVFFHGGGFVIGSVETHDNQARALCRTTESVVVSVDYRLAPESRWPAAVEDCFAATRWAAENIATLGGDPSRLAVAGDSAGGNLAAVIAQLSRVDGPALAAQLLIYPATDMDQDVEYASREENAEGYFLTADEMRWFAENYIPDGADRDDPRLSPMRASDLSGLPPAVVVTAEYDPLRDEGDAYAEALRSAGVPVRHHRFPGLVHGFFDMALISPAAAAAIEAASLDFAALLGSEPVAVETTPPGSLAP